MSDRTRFWLVETIFGLVFLLWVFGSPELLVRRSPVWVPSALWGVSFLLLAPALIALQEASYKHFLSQLAELVVSVFIAIAFGVILVGAEHRDAPVKMIQEKLVDAAVVAIAVFAITSIARSSRLLGQSADLIKQVQHEFSDFSTKLTEHETLLAKQEAHLAKQETLHEQNKQLRDQGQQALASSTEITGSLQRATHEAMRGIAEARYGGLAAKALGLKQIEVLKDGKNTFDKGIVDATEPGLGALAAWIYRGKGISEESARKAWWRVMNVYHQEEIYDVSSKEIATNVRSYAYTLLLVVSELLESLGAGRKLVVANISGFAPKDFYNFPNGRLGSRFYHEAEFFGIYRRLLAVIAADQRVVPLRVVLADPSESGKRLLGGEIAWELDPIWKLVLDCARLYIVPWPVVGSRRPGEQRDVDVSAHDDFVPASRRQQWGVAFPDGRDPAAKLPYKTSRFLFVPTYAEFRNLERLPAPSGTRQSRLDWIERALPYERAYDRSIDLAKLRAEASSVDGTDLVTRLKALRTGCTAFCDIYLGQSSGDRANLRNRCDDAWKDILIKFFEWLGISDEGVREKIRARVELEAAEPITASTDMAATADDEARYLTDVNEAYLLSKAIVKYRIGNRDYTKALLDLSALCHRLDATGKYLQIETGNFTETPVVSSAGVELGLAENWLHRFLVWLEASRVGNDIRSGGPLPLWKLMGRDLCGVETDLDSFLSGIGNRLRICTVGEGGTAPQRRATWKSSSYSRNSSWSGQYHKTKLIPLEASMISAMWTGLLWSERV